MEVHTKTLQAGAIHEECFLFPIRNTRLMTKKEKQSQEKAENSKAGSMLRTTEEARDTAVSSTWTAATPSHSSQESSGDRCGHPHRLDLHVPSVFHFLLWLDNALKESRHETYCLGDQLTTQIVPFFICSSIPTTLENKGEITYTRPREIVFHTIQMEIQLETDYLLIRKRSQ